MTGGVTTVSHNRQQSVLTKPQVQSLRKKIASEHTLAHGRILPGIPGVYSSAYEYSLDVYSTYAYSLGFMEMPSGLFPLSPPTANDGFGFCAYVCYQP